MSYKIVHYVNQFFAGIGGEDQGDVKPDKKTGAVGPGLAMNMAFGSEAEVVGTVYCGDNYYGENTVAARKAVLAMIKSFNPDAVVAGPAFLAGRYGVACGDVCASVEEELGIPAVTGMFPENPGVDLYRNKIFITETADNAKGMKTAAEKMGKLLLKRLKKEQLGSAKTEGYIHRGMRKNFLKDKSAAQRGVEMLIKKLKGEPFETEYEMPVFKKIKPAPPVKDIKKATIAIITTGGIVPKGNPDRIKVSSAENYGKWDISKIDDLTPENFESIHGGYDNTYANKDPDYVFPLDVMRELEKEGFIGKLYNYAYYTTGTATSVANAEKFGQDIGNDLKNSEVAAAILTST